MLIPSMYWCKEDTPVISAQIAATLITSCTFVFNFSVSWEVL